MNTRSEINNFLKDKRFALVGMSENPKKFSRMIHKELTAKGYDVVPVNPKMDEMEGKKVYHDISDLPADIQSVLIMTPKAVSLEMMDKAVAHGVKNIWVQQGAHTNETLDKAKQIDKHIVHNKCVMMFADPVKGVHGFHRFMARIFGKMPS